MDMKCWKQRKKKKEGEGEKLIAFLFFFFFDYWFLIYASTHIQGQMLYFNPTIIGFGKTVAHNNNIVSGQNKKSYLNDGAINHACGG